MYSTVPPWLQHWLSLIDALTGAPDRLFPTDGSEVVSCRRAYKTLSPSGPLSTVAHPERVSSSQLFTKENIAHFFFLVNRQKIEGQVEEKGSFDGDFLDGGEEESGKYQKKVYHNLQNGYILKKLQFFTNYDKSFFKIYHILWWILPKNGID